MSTFKIGDKVRVKEGILYLGGPNNKLSLDRVYEVEKICGTDIYVKDRTNYFRLEHLELVS